MILIFFENEAIQKYKQEFQNAVVEYSINDNNANEDDLTWGRMFRISKGIS